MSSVIRGYRTVGNKTAKRGSPRPQPGRMPGASRGKGAKRARRGRR